MDILSLRNIVFSTQPRQKALPGYECSTLGLYGRSTLGLDCDEIYPNIFIGDRGTAFNKAYLQLIGITHVLNAAEGNGPASVNTNAQFYADVGIVYMGLPLTDDPLCNVIQYAGTFSTFISNSLINGGKVLINCYRGRSRSTTVAIACLRIEFGMPVPMALRLCCRERYTNPNDGFLVQLVNLENCLNG